MSGARLLLPALLAATLGGCLDETWTADQALIGAETTDDYPFVVATRWVKHDFDKVICTGVLVAPDWVLTVAHCVPDEWDADFSEVLVGPSYAAAAQSLAIAEVFVHPGRDPQGTWLEGYPDVALLRLDGCADAVPIDVPEGPVLDESWIGESFLVVSYGRFDEAQPADGLKRVGQFRFSAIEDLSVAYAGLDGVDTTLGDSGAPALVVLGDGLQAVALHRGDTGQLEGSRLDAVAMFVRDTVEPSPDCEAQDDPPDDDEGCACAADARLGPAAAGVALAALLLYWRRGRSGP